MFSVVQSSLQTPLLWSLPPWAPALFQVKTVDSYSFPKLSGQGSDETAFSLAEDDMFS